jgi:hypothetical protein
MNYNPFSILLPSLACVLSLGCDQADHSAAQPRDQQATAAKSATEPSESPYINPYQIPLKLSQVPIGNTVAKANFQKVGELRKVKGATQANAEFKRLCELWNPVGRPVSEVKEVVGKPDWEKEDSFGYVFDTGSNAWVWTFFSNKGEVSKIQGEGY